MLSFAAAFLWVACGAVAAGQSAAPAGVIPHGVVEAVDDDRLTVTLTNGVTVSPGASAWLMVAGDRGYGRGSLVRFTDVDEAAEAEAIAVVEQRGQGRFAPAEGQVVELAEGPGAGRAVLYVESEPADARVSINDESLQETPIVFTLEPGTHTVRLVRLGYDSFRTEITLEPGDRQQLQASLNVDPPPRVEARANRIVLPEGQVLSLAFIRGGSFERGSWRGAARADNTPLRELTVRSFRLGRTPVTVGQFRTFVEDVNYTTDAEHHGWCETVGERGQRTRAEGLTWRDPGFRQGNDHPVVCVSWEDARRFAAWAGARLPTEAEWEYAARSGGERVRYPWGDTPPADTLAQYGRNGHTAPVRAFDANPSGFFAMAGTVAEWCRDWYSSYYYAQAPDTNPSGPEEGSARVVRGGSWASPARGLRTYARAHQHPRLPSTDVGFRVVHP